MKAFHIASDAGLPGERQEDYCCFDIALGSAAKHASRYLQPRASAQQSSEVLLLSAEE